MRKFLVIKNADKKTAGLTQRKSYYRGSLCNAMYHFGSAEDVVNYLADLQMWRRYYL